MMRMSRRTPRRPAAALAASLTALALAATACGGSGGDAGGDGGPVTLTYWSWLKGQKEAVELFNRTHKDVQVRFEEIPAGANGGYDKISNAVKAGNAPDVATVEYAMLPAFVTQGVLKDLPSAGASTVKGRYPASVGELVTFGGKTWAMPRDIGTMVYFYRRDLFDKHGLAVPRTWDDYKAAAEKVRKADSKARLGSFLTDDPVLLAGLSWQAGARWFGTQGDSWKVAIDSPESRKVADYWQGLVDKDLVKAQSATDPLTQSMQKGEVLSVISGAWNAGVLKTLVPGQSGKWAVAPLPSWNGRPTSAGYGGAGAALTKGTTKADKATQFITWLNNSADGIRAQLSSGTSSALPASPDLVPVAAKTFDTAFYGGQDIYKVAGDALGTMPTGWAWGPAMAATNTELKTGINAFTSGSAKLADALTAAQGKTVAELKGRGLSVTS